MTETITIALISTGGTFLTAVSALILGYRMFGSIERRVERVEEDLKEFNKIQTRVEAELSRIKEHLGLKP